MENQIPSTTQPITNQTPQVPLATATNWKKIALLVVLVLVLMGGSIFTGIQIGKNQLPKSTPPVVTNPTVTPEVQPTTNPVVPSNTPAPTTSTNWESYGVPKTEFTKGFTLYYPQTWQLQTQPSIRLSKGTSYFDIRQGAGSAGACLFNDDKDNPDAPQFASIFPSFKEIIKNNQLTWRLATVENPKSWDDTYILCEKKSGNSFYRQDTSMGYVPFRIPQSDTATINEVLEILKKVEITP